MLSPIIIVTLGFLFVYIILLMVPKSKPKNTACGKPLPGPENFPSYAVSQKLKYHNYNASPLELIESKDEDARGYVVLNSSKHKIKLSGHFIDHSIDLTPEIESGNVYTWKGNKLVYPGLRLSFQINNDCTNIEENSKGIKFKVPYTPKNNLALFEVYDTPSGKTTLTTRVCSS